ncbi:nitrilase family protein [Colletotrichum truncatum]|uniref:Nitrilase family protein n=1 Tax=Colletotrichum truncatum TaxID=5467 RepID=A0ACC3YNL4_COLTU|nr:nitrilase family protein [Colletotrichum truncatum]XP_036581153.1 nitrilase family protein [Colletotrichum truncatum]KAF6780605.1 nitrilase family protein [Colletotrichum truncatum]KAF6789421.1 nitrilase family protein [Colletotrichum truncatum]
MSHTQEPGLLRKSVKIACIQFASGPDKPVNLKEAHRLVLEASSKGAGIVVLPECFNSPYSTTSFPAYAEVLQPAPPPEESSPSFHALSRMAKDANVYLIGGSIPELESDTRNIYNTTLVFSPDGELLGQHRKAHLFDVDFPGKMTFRESDTLSPGNSITTVELPEYGTIGLGICYDIRFAEFSTVASRRGAFALIFPSAFNSTTGPLHWELLARARALDNQLYVAMCSQSFEPDSGYPAWGHSMVVDPNGQIVATTERGPAIVYADLDDASIGQARKQVPIGFQRRFDLYPDISKLA